jgi:hypothetical protein
MQFLWGVSYGCYIFTYGTWLIQSLSLGSSEDAYSGALALSGVLLAVRQTANAVLDIPAGVMADVTGRLRLIRIAFAFKTAFHLGLFSLMFFGGTRLAVFLGFALSLAFSVAYSSFSGAFSSWVVGQVVTAEAGANYKPILAKGHTAFFWGELVAGAGSASLLAQERPEWAYLVGATVCMINLIAALQERADTPAAPIGILAGSFREMVPRFATRLRHLRDVFLQLPGTALLIVTYASFMFLLNIVEYFWPVFLKQELHVEQAQWIWVGVVVSVCVVRLAGAKWLAGCVIMQNDLSSGEMSAGRARAWFLSLCVLSSGMAVIYSFVSPQGHGFIGLGIAVVLLVVFVHGLAAPAYDIVVNSSIPHEFDGSRATILSLGTTIRSIFAIAFAIPASTLGWGVPALILLAAALLTTLFSIPISIANER